MSALSPTLAVPTCVDPDQCPGRGTRYQRECPMTGSTSLATPPETCPYEELNVFGTPTGKVHHAQEGDQLPRAPRGFKWRRVRQEGC